MRCNLEEKIIVLCIFSIILSSFMISTQKTNFLDEKETSEVKNIENKEFIDLFNIKTSNYWNDFTFIHIKNNWSIAVSLGWCKGSGNYTDPYVLENISIDATNSPTGCGILIENSNDYFLIQNCTVFNATAGASNAGIKLDQAHNGTLINNNCSNNYASGIFLINSNNNTISNNIVKNNSRFGIYQEYGTNNTISWNNISNNGGDGQFTGISLLYSYNNTISNNLVSNNSINGIYLSSCSFNNLFNNTILYSEQYGIYLSESNNNSIFYNNISYNNLAGDYFGLYLSDSDSNSILKNSLKENYYGVYLLNSNRNNISNNKVLDHIDHGIYLSSSNKNIITNNNVSGNDDGMRIESSSFNIIEQNRVTYNNYRGIYLLTNSKNNTIIGNNISYNGLAGIYHGIYLDDSSNNSLLDNYIKDSDHGIYLHTTSKNIIINNTVIFCDNNGIVLNDNQFISIFNNTVSNNNQHGIALSSSNNTTIFNNKVDSNIGTGIILDSNSESNLIFKNIISGNGLNELDDGNYNDWNKSGIGNFWDNYTELGGGAVDIDDDGIGDIPYPISGTAGSQDFHPQYIDTDDVAPTIIIVSPSNNTSYVNAPMISITVYDFYSINSTWYSIYGTSKNITFIGNSITIESSLWKGLAKGSYRIRFFVNDSVGHISFKDILVIKTLDPSDPIITDDDDDKEGEKQGYQIDIIMLFIFIIILSVVGVSISTLYIVHSTRTSKSGRKKTKKIRKDKYFDNKRLLDIFSGENVIENISKNSDISITFISEEFFEKLEYFTWLEQDLHDFIEEMLDLVPERRMSILDEMIEVSEYIKSTKRKARRSDL